MKLAVAEAVVSFTEPFATRVAEVMADPAEIDRILARGAEQARAVAAATVADVFERVGFVPPLVGRAAGVSDTVTVGVAVADAAAARHRPDQLAQAGSATPPPS